MADMVKDGRLTIRFSAELRQQLKEAARQNGTRESEIVRRAVENQFAAKANEMTALDRAKKAGIIGVVKGVSPDLSTNPRYMNGFGES